MLEIVTLDSVFLKQNIADIIFIEKQLIKLLGNDYDTLEWTEKEFLHSLPQKYKYSFGITLEGRLVGFSIAYEFMSNYCHISRVGVLPEFSGNGYGAELFKSQLLTMYNNGIKICSIDLTKSNTRAFSFYSKFGFRRLLNESLESYILIKSREKHEYKGDNYTHLALLKEF